MTSLRWYLPLVLLPITLADAAMAEETCECADIADLRNREAEQRAAIQAYQNAISQWGSAAPTVSEAERKQFQSSVIQPAINNATTSGTNKAKGETDAICKTTIGESTACMKEVASQHEHVHAEACYVHRENPSLSFARWSNLADYAREEIAAYQAEAAYTHGALVDLQSKCELHIEMTSEIRGGTEVAVSNAKGKVLASFSAPDHQATSGYRGAGSLEYKTRDVGPPKKVGDPMLMKLMPVCYATSVGSGKTPFTVLDGYLRRSTMPPYEPQLDLIIEIHPTGETRILKGERGCPKQQSRQPFWSEMFILAKTTTTARNHVLIDGWTFAPRPGVYAEKIIQSTCGQSVSLPGPFASLGPVAPCAEKTTFTVRLKR